MSRPTPSVARAVPAFLVAAALLWGCGGGSSARTDTGGTLDTMSATDEGPAVDPGAGADEGPSRDVPIDEVADAADSVVDAYVPPPCTQGEPCDDNDPCSVDDECTDAGFCRGTVVEGCNDGLACTTDGCTAADACTNVLKAGWCLVEGRCYAEGEGDPEAPCRSCLTLVATDALSIDDGLACEDGNGCTQGDFCKSGACVPGPVDCSDDSPCTADSCANGTCQHEVLEGACDDGDPCTTGDACAAGVCVGIALACDDGQGCTKDECDPAAGCVHSPLEGDCEDGNACTTGDRCEAGACVAGTGRPDCDDQDPCTDDGCVPSKGCVHIPNVAPCDDGDPCTVGDVCNKGACIPGKDLFECEEKGVCFDVACVAGTGCVATPNSAPCDDLDPCFTDDACEGGECRQGPTPLSCDDDNTCTDDTCDKGIGCAHTNNVAACDDGSVCTFDDTCADGECVGARISCDDAVECTVDKCDKVAGCLHEPDMVKPECRPVIEILYPPRAATLDGAAGLTIQGKATSKAGFVTALTLTFNGTPHVLLPSPVDGTFSLAVTSGHGFNSIVVDAEDQFARKDHLVQSYYYSTKWYPIDAANPDQSRVNDGLMIFLGPEVWDDNDTSDVDDIASIMLLYVKTIDFGGMISNPVATGSQYGCDYKVNLGTISFNRNAMTVDLVPVNGGLWMKVVIPNLSIPFNADFSGNFGLCNAFDTSGTVTASSVVITATLLVSVDPAGDPVVQMSATDVKINGLNIDASNFLVDLIAGFLTGTLTTQFENAFEDQLGPTVGEAVADALTGLALDQEFAIDPLVEGGKPATLKINTKFSTLSFTTAGGTIGFKATVVEPKGTTHNPKGSIGRASCLTGAAEPFAFPKEGSLELALHDDFFNQIPFGIYWAGALAFPVPASLLAGQDLSAFGITDMAMSIDFLLAPILTSCTPSGNMEIQIGDMAIDASLSLFGTPIQMRIYASMAAPASIEAKDGAEGKEIGIAMGAPTFLDMEIASLTGGLAGADETLGAMIKQQLLPQVIAAFTGNAFGSFPIPTIDLAAINPSVPAGSEIAIDLQKVLRDHAYTVLSGNVK